uniref:Cdl-1 n=1 Tax=Pristionchus pacificus TaxID=54126 RepID=A0A2A6B3V8_PRIPA|eukprot:PDM60566.1 cdl-1 [Pristionchus pacificus]
MSSNRTRSKSPAAQPVELRRSPRKKAWASPSKTPTRNALANSSLFNDSDFSPLANASWAEVMEGDVENNARLISTAERRNRKPSSPKRAATKPKFRLTVTSGSRKRHLSNASTVVDEGASPRKRAAPSSSGRPSRKNAKASEGTPSPARSRLFSSNSTSSPATPSIRPKEFYDAPKNGWCEKQETIDRRTKEIGKAKEKPIYAKYLKEVPIGERIKGIHPATPNKLLNHTRRSWDMQIKNWKRSLYAWAGEEPSESANTSFYSESAEEEAEQAGSDKGSVLASLTVEDIKETGMTTLMGRFDVGMADESTLKASSATVDGPVDFSAGIHN